MTEPLPFINVEMLLHVRVRHWKYSYTSVSFQMDVKRAQRVHNVKGTRNDFQMSFCVIMNTTLLKSLFCFHIQVETVEFNEMEHRLQKRNEYL